MKPKRKKAISHEELVNKPLRPLDRAASSTVDQLRTSAQKLSGDRPHSSQATNHTLRFLQRVQRQAKQIHQEHADNLLTPQEAAVPTIRDAFIGESKKPLVVPPPTEEEIPAQRDVEAELNARIMQRRQHKRLKNLQKLAVNSRLPTSSAAREREDEDMKSSSLQGGEGSNAVPAPLFVPSASGASGSHAAASVIGSANPTFRRTIEDDLQVHEHVDADDFFDDYAALPEDPRVKMDDEDGGFF